LLLHTTPSHPASYPLSLHDALPILDLLLTVVWMIGIINAVNIIDVMDGLAGGVSVIACLWLFVVALVNHDTMIAMMLASPSMTSDRKSTRLNSSHVKISYAVFCLKK